MFRPHARVHIEEWWPVVVIAALLLFVRLSLYRVRIDRLIRWCSSSRPVLGMGAITPTRLRSLVVALGRRMPFACSCLVRSLTLTRVLRGRGYAAELRMGVRRLPDGLEAHAWVELNGHPLGEDVDVALYEPWEGLYWTTERPGT